VGIPYGALTLASLPPGSSWTVNQLEAEARAGRQGRIADHLTRLDFVVFNELGYLPFAPAGGQLLFHLVSRPNAGVMAGRTMVNGSGWARLRRDLSVALGGTRVAAKEVRI